MTNSAWVRNAGSFVCSLLLLLPSASDARMDTVRGIGVVPIRDGNIPDAAKRAKAEAIYQAASLAVEQSLGARIDEPEFSDTYLPLVQRQFRRNPKNLSDAPDGKAQDRECFRWEVVGRYDAEEVRAHATTYGFFAAKAGEVRPSIMVIIPEEHIRLRRFVVPDPAGQNAVVAELIANGFDVRTSQTISEEQWNCWLDGETSCISPQLAEFARDSRGTADLVVFGEAFSTNRSDLGGLGVQGAEARVEVEVFEVATGRVICAESQHAASVGVSELVAGKTALKWAGEMVAKRIIPRIVDDIQEGRQYGIPIDLEISPMSFRQIENHFLPTLRDQVRINHFRICDFRGDHGTVRVRFEGRPQELSAILNGRWEENRFRAPDGYYRVTQTEGRTILVEYVRS